MGNISSISICFYQLIKALAAIAWDLAEVLKRPEPHFSLSPSLSFIDFLDDF